MPNDVIVLKCVLWPTSSAAIKLIANRAVGPEAVLNCLDLSAVEKSPVQVRVDTDGSCEIYTHHFEYNNKDIILASYDQSWIIHIHTTQFRDV